MEYGQGCLVLTAKRSQQSREKAASASGQSPLAVACERRLGDTQRLLNSFVKPLPEITFRTSRRLIAGFGILWLP